MYIYIYIFYSCFYKHRPCAYALYIDCIGLIILINPNNKVWTKLLLALVLLFSLRLIMPINMIDYENFIVTLLLVADNEIDGIICRE